jgi:hypothetical protein
MKLFTTLCCAALTLCSAIIQVMHSSFDSILILRSQTGTSALAVVSRLSENATDAKESTSVVLNRRGNDLQLYRVLLDNHTAYQLISAE